MFFGKPLLIAFSSKPKGYAQMLPSHSRQELKEETLFDTHMSLENNSSIYEEEPEEAHKMNQKLGIEISKTENDEHSKQESHHDSLGEVFVHQTIETIEFVLGSVSNTASYLRLWALSLAHRQLSVVFFEMLVLPSLTRRDSVFVALLSIIVCFSLFIVITFGVLMLMDLLECFLHSLRLHW